MVCRRLTGYRTFQVGSFVGELATRTGYELSGVRRFEKMRGFENRWLARVFLRFCGRCTAYRTLQVGSFVGELATRTGYELSGVRRFEKMRGFENRWLARVFPWFAGDSLGTGPCRWGVLATRTWYELSGVRRFENMRVFEKMRRSENVRVFEKMRRSENM